MTHLHDSEFIDALDGTLPPARASHQAACDACRSQVEALRASLAAVVSAQPPEPSPLFWDHFAARVNERIDTEPGRGHWFTVPRLAFVTVGALALLLVGINLLVTQGRGTTVPAPPIAMTGEAPGVTPEPDDLEADLDWAIVRAAADDLDVEDAQAQGLTAKPGTADQIAMELTASERAELLRLIEREIKTGA